MSTGYRAHDSAQIAFLARKKNADIAVGIFNGFICA